MFDIPSIALASMIISSVVFITRWFTHPLKSIPTAGRFRFRGLSYLDALYNTFYAKISMEAGLDKYYGSAFKLAMLDGWMVIVSGPGMIDDLRRRPTHELSISDGLLEYMHFDRYLSHASLYDAPHLQAVKMNMTVRKIKTMIPVLVDELRHVMDDIFPKCSSGWEEVQIFTTMQCVITRMSNRIFVGIPMCRNKEYIELATEFPPKSVKRGFLLGLCPHLLKRHVARWLNPFPLAVKQTLPLFSEIIEDRRSRTMERYDTWEKKPDDVLQWLIENASEKKHSDADIVESLFLLNLAATHNTASSLTQAIYHLTERPELISLLRDEIHPIIATEGWTAESFDKMEKLDSFLAECQRYDGVGMTSMIRKAMKDITLEDGTIVPEGALVHAAAYAVHHNEASYPCATKFDALRFLRLRTQADALGTKYQLTSASPDYMPFGYGRHACPGRFFAAIQIKLVLAFMILGFDLCFGGDGTRPENVDLGFNILSDPRGLMLFRQRPD
ncbi:cytochrome P450 [Dichomitus squalens]|uniref:Cytochrome P450 n=1 Tax=Dichomitus squalens TaxID=114155 RepID=A0A4Q9NT01_9APHY|nr:cytochrome P450 [Dichomitus squalens]TBU53709.1 cytochrome P450 [Dichomitus squalens]